MLGSTEYVFLLYYLLKIHFWCEALENSISNFQITKVLNNQGQLSDKEPIEQGRLLPIDSLKIMVSHWKMLCSDFPLCGCYASSFVDQGGFMYSFFLPAVVKPSGALVAFLLQSGKPVVLRWRDDLHREGERGGCMGCMGPSDRCTAMLRALLRDLAACTAKGKKPRLIAGWKSSSRMHSLGFLWTGTAFGASVHKKDGLHLGHAWLVAVILVALFITEAYMLVLFCFPS